MKTETKVRELADWPIAVPVKEELKSPAERFYERLAKTPRRWKIGEAGEIRSRAWWQLLDRCPVSAVTGRDSDYGHPDSALREMGVSYWDAVEIFMSADRSCSDPSRARLLEACGLEERHDS